MTGKDSGSGGLRERKKRATRAALTEAAVRLAAEQGADNVTVEAISAAAGVSVRTFFNYFDSRDDAFVVIDADAGLRVRRALLDAPAALSPLDALREALAVELSEAERQHELWSLHAEVLRTSPHLLVRSLGAHMADETGLAEVIAQRLAAGGVPLEDGADGERRPVLDLYPRLLAAVAGTAVRVSVQHWCERQDEHAFADVFREVFALLAAGLPAPAR
ncbi:TetR family transcriptional regulator [Streptomyces capillispiralis]|uniref:TetR family transcriptional regulator n=2 Tax=Streptomyces capillispiralis TaxID=68182 RepID=A0A561T7U1_9ACTN|nr:TetR family transcriptional regulator [Streptomyces capillispiralis]GHH94586.1 TetR family transcriptional regulator [Streptomyces capillispiralis]